MISGDAATFLKKKKNCGSNFGPTVLNQNQIKAFRHLLSSLFFFETAHNDSLQQCLTSSRGKTHERKHLGPKFVSKEPKFGPKLGFSPFSQVWFVSFS